MHHGEEKKKFSSKKTFLGYLILVFLSSVSLQLSELKVTNVHTQSSNNLHIPLSLPSPLGGKTSFASKCIVLSI